MNRQQSRQSSREMQKRLSKMSTAEFEGTINNIIFRAQEEVMEAYREALHERFGFGPGRMEKLMVGVMKRLEER
ncbi:MAG: hypothetical protein GT589_02070 [Peptoclostridium sp.]|nr:hypothetical protein [Peptoclostridium sp.]